jgi:hypothetical protein
MGSRHKVQGNFGELMHRRANLAPPGRDLFLLPRWVAITGNNRDEHLATGLRTAARAGVRNCLGSGTELDQVGLTADLFPHNDMTAQADNGPAPEVCEIDGSVHGRSETARDVACSRKASRRAWSPTSGHPVGLRLAVALQHPIPFTQRIECQVQRR